MPRLTKIYTRTGDDGTTSLGTRTRAAKNSLRVAANGDVDELNSAIGLAIAHRTSHFSMEALTSIQNDLFHLGSQLAFPMDEETKIDLPQIEEKHIEKLERLIDDAMDELGPLANFILPGGCEAAAHLHYARSVCRRAERSVVSLLQEESIEEFLLPYLNRLSDVLFVLARFENKVAGIEDKLWDSHA